MENIKINSLDYNCLGFEYFKENEVEHLLIKLEGELKDRDNELKIEHQGINYHGAKLLPYLKDGNTCLMVYIFQREDSELLCYQ